MGHVDHGKTTLLDFLRKTKVAEGEAGGITQSVGAYEIEKDGKKITFIDTPGHAAFSSMRQRGANIADLAILVVAADDGVKPQTKEAIDILHEAQMPFAVAINKIDKNNADPEKTKQDLMQNGVMLEKLGGDVPWHLISAKEGEGVDELLDVVLIMWELLDLTYNPSANAKGFVLEARQDSQRGPLATVIIKDGTLRTGDDIFTASAEGKIKGLENFLGKRVDTLEPSSPAVVLGFSTVASVGEAFVAGALSIEERKSLLPAVVVDEPNKIGSIHEDDGAVHVVLRADVGGSLEALAEMLEAMEIEGKKIEVLSKKVGDITDGDIKRAMPANAFVVGFNVKVKKEAQNLAKSQKVVMITSNIIYRIIEELERQLKEETQNMGGGELEILAVFSSQGRKQVVGGKMVRGLLTLNDRVSIMREGEKVGMGRITNLQQGKNDCKKVLEGECGLRVDSSDEIQVGDQLVVVEE